MSAKNKRLMEKPKASRRGFIAKLLVLCMIVGLVPTIQLAFAAGGDSGDTYSITTDTVTNGKVEYAYGSSHDTYYTVTKDTTFPKNAGTVSVKFTPDSGYKLSNSSYIMNGDARVENFGGSKNQPVTKDITDVKGNITIYAVFEYVSGGSSSPSSSGSTSATVSSIKAANGSFAVSDKNAKAGDTVKVTPKPDKGFVVDNVVVKDKNGDSVPVTKNADGTFSFVMPDKKLQPVTVDVAFREELVTDIYTDVPADAWYATAVKYCYDNGLMTGVGDGEFSPETTTTRGQVVTVLWNIEGQPSVSGTGGFDDVASGDWYAPAIAWAKASGVVGGYSATQFGPKDEMTREQLAVVMWRYAEYKGYNTQLTADLSGYTDASQISDWAEAGMEWANHEGLINGTSATTLAPVESSTRGQLAQIFMSYCENVVK